MRIFLRALALTLLISAAQSQISSTQSEILCEGFVETNSLRIPVPRSGDFNAQLNMVSEGEFNTAIDKVTNVYTSIFQSKGMALRVRKKWSDSQVNAVAYKEGAFSVVEIWGGLARHDMMTTDGLTLVMCHEVGHHMGGAPKYSDSPQNNWASVEGQSDYFATAKCLRKVFAPEADTWAGAVDSRVKSRCEESFGVDTREAKICGRIGMASMASAKLSASISGAPTPDFSTTDPTVVSRTYESHPRGQCRLDTYVNGDVCRVSDTVDLSNTNHETGACRNIASESYGARPLCWYKPVASPTPGPTPTPTPTPTPVPTPQPGPGGIAATPLLNGMPEFATMNPNQMINFSWNVSGSQGAASVYYEVIGPNREFSQPNGTIPERGALSSGVIPARAGQFAILPARQLPGWGVYKFRVIPLDRSGRIPMGRFSDPAVLRLGQ